jgi:hypothetical protein
MNFNISLGNFAGPTQSVMSILLRSILAGDMIRYVRCALEELGHTVTVNRSYVDPDAVNLFIERFYGGEEDVAALSRAGIRWGLICPEQLTVEGLYNPFESQRDKARQIYDEFAGAARRADFIWYLLEEAGPVCRKLNPNSRFLPFGFVERFAELGDPASRRLLFDFNLSGVPGGRRLRFVDSLKARGFRMSTCHSEPDFVRLSMLEASRITLSVQKSENHHIFSPGRVPHAIMNRVPIIVEYDGPPCYLAKYCVVAKPDALLDTCLAMAARPDLARLAQDFYDRFASEFPMRPIMQRVVDETFAARPS